MRPLFDGKTRIDRATFLSQNFAKLWRNFGKTDVGKIFDWLFWKPGLRCDIASLILPGIHWLKL
jgi:hypothetical protein